MDWTPRQAGYRLGETITTNTSVTAVTAHHPGKDAQVVPTKHGLVIRIWIGPDHAEVLLRRHVGITETGQPVAFQGSVRAVEGGWAAFDANSGRRVSEVHGEYLDAEAPLLRLRTGCSAHGPGRGLAQLALDGRLPATYRAR